MWILFISVIELLRFLLTLAQVRQSTGLFGGLFGALAFMFVDWLFFFVLLPVLFHYYPLPRLGVDNALGKWLRARVQLSVQLANPDQVAELAPDQPYIFACHSHGVVATTELLVFMMRAAEFPSLSGYPLSAVCTVSSQLWMLPITSLVCRLLGGQPVSNLHNLIVAGQPAVVSPGGAQEISLVQFDTARKVHIIRNTGFLYEAYLKKRPIVPLLTLGNHSMYRTPDLFRDVQWALFSLIGYGMPMPAFGAYGSVVPLETSSVTVLQLPTFAAESDEENFETYTERYYANLASAAMSRNVELVCFNRTEAWQKLGSSF